MHSLQQSLNSLKNFVIQQEANNNFAQNFPSCKNELVYKIKSVLKSMKEIKVEKEFDGYFEIQAELKSIKKVCKGDSAPEKLSEKIQRINLLYQFNFGGSTEFTLSELKKINKMPITVSTFRAGKEKMALGVYGTEAQKMVMDDDLDIWDCIPRFGVWHRAISCDINRLRELKMEGAKMLKVQADALQFKTDQDQQEKRIRILEKTIPYFNTLCDDLISLCPYLSQQNINKQTQQLICKQLANVSLTNDETKTLNESKEAMKVIHLVKEIPQIITTNDRAEFTAIMKGVFASKENLQIELKKIDTTSQAWSTSAAAIDPADPDSQAVIDLLTNGFPHDQLILPGVVLSANEINLVAHHLDLSGAVLSAREINIVAHHLDLSGAVFSVASRLVSVNPNENLSAHRLDLSDRDLSGAVFSAGEVHLSAHRLDLSDMDLSGAVLSGDQSLESDSDNEMERVD